jgi:hypothetical protein
LQALFSNLKQSKSMIYKIFLLLLLVVSFLQAICSSQRLKQKTKRKQNMPKQKKNTSESNAEVVYNNLNSNQFALPKLESFSPQGFYLLKEKGLVSKTYLL